MNNIQNQLSHYLLKSALDQRGIHDLQSVLDWYANKRIHVDIRRESLADCQAWIYDEDSGRIRHETGGFFEIAGLKLREPGGRISEQPILLQSEIGYLGILCTLIDDQLYFLIQAKIEPGNLNQIQLSPTIQATKSNFTQLHGGRKPYYFDLFNDAPLEQIIIDQLQSEQSSRFLGKRNRNIIVYAPCDEIKIENDQFIWLTLGQIKALLKFDNLVNMDTRTVLSCLPFYDLDETLCNDIAPVEHASQSIDLMHHPLFRSMTRPEHFDVDDQVLVRIYHAINHYKMFDQPERRICALSELSTWAWDVDQTKLSSENASFRVIFCKIEIEGRELRHWHQPLFEATGKALFGLLYKIESGVMKFCVKLCPELGCFDSIEIGPTFQIEAEARGRQDHDRFEQYYQSCVANRPDLIHHQVVLSEEGGRFYHEENDNVILKFEESFARTQNISMPTEAEGYAWVTYRQLNRCVQFNNVLNIQLRNLMTLLDFNHDYEGRL